MFNLMHYFGIRLQSLGKTTRILQLAEFIKNVINETEQLVFFLISCFKFAFWNQDIMFNLMHYFGIRLHILGKITRFLQLAEFIKNVINETEQLVLSRSPVLNLHFGIRISCLI
jgi:hypothetical protein